MTDPVIEGLAKLSKDSKLGEGGRLSDGSIRRVGSALPDESAPPIPHIRPKSRRRMQLRIICISEDSERGDGGFRGSGLPKPRSDVSVLEWAVLCTCVFVLFFIFVLVGLL